MGKNQAIRISRHAKNTRISDAAVNASAPVDTAHETEDKVEAAIKESVRRFVSANRENIERSTKEKVATASYGGGMLDMVTLIRAALGRWAVEELLRELVRWNRIESVGGSEPVRVDVGGIDKGGLSREEAQELGKQIARWIEEKKNKHDKTDVRRAKDPMFA